MTNHGLTYPEYIDKVFEYLEYIEYPKYVQYYEPADVAQSIEGAMHELFSIGWSPYRTAIFIFGCTWTYQIARRTEDTIQ